MLLYYIGEIYKQKCHQRVQEASLVQGNSDDGRIGGKQKLCYEARHKVEYEPAKSAKW